MRALQGTRTTSAQAIVRSRLVESTRVPMMAGTLQPAAAINGITARPCRPKRCMTRSARNAAAFM